MASAVARATKPPAPSSISIQDKMTRNKRKFRTDQSTADLVVPVYPLRPSDCPNYGPSSNEKGTESYNLEHLASMCDMCKHLICGTEEGVEWEDGFNDADWSEITETRLEEIVINNIDMIFKNAINVVSSYGYPEEAARNAVLTAGARDSSKEPLSALVDGALAVLRGDKEMNSSSNFEEDLEKTEKSVLARMVTLVIQQQPFFSRGDAMWCLLICDMSVPRACVVDYEPANPIESGTSSGTLPVNETNAGGGSQSNVQCEMPKVLGLPTVPNGRPPSIPSNVWNVISNLKHDDPNFSEHCKPLKEGGKKGGGNSKKDSVLRNKSISLEKSLRALGSKTASKGCKHGIPGNLILDRKCKYTASDSSSGITVKSTFKLSKIVGGGVLRKDAVLDLSFHATKASSSSNSNTNNTSTSVSTNSTSSPSATPTTDTDLSLSLQSTGPANANVKGTANSDAKANPDTKAKSDMKPNGKAVEAGNVSSDGVKSWKDWVPQNSRDEVAAKLLPHMREMQAQIQDWTDWAQQKVMQATRRLVKDKEELQLLRQEREEEGRLHEERKSLEESTKKKLAEMEAAIAKASGQVEKASAAARRLEVENAHLRLEMEAAKMQAAVSAATCRELSKNKVNSLKRFETWESEWALMKDELLIEKDKISELQTMLLYHKKHFDCVQGYLSQEQKEKTEILAQLYCLKKEKEHIETAARAEENALMVKSENETQRFKSEIRELEQRIQQVCLADLTSKMVAPKWGPPDTRSYAARLAQGKNGVNNGTRVPAVTKGRMERGVLLGSVEDEVQRERECVMCLSEEMSVVFLPCAHQVVCITCNEMHERQGMKDCPSCRSPILRRIVVRPSYS